MEDTDKIVLFAPVEMPETCYVSEVAYWLAFGRVPEIFYDNDGEARMGEEVKYRDDLVPFDQGFSWAEFKWAGVEVDRVRYSRACSATFGKTGEEHIDEFQQHVTKFYDRETMEEDEWQEVEPRLLEWQKRVWNEANDADWARNVERALYPIVDAARSKVFQALVNGQLPAFGYVDEYGPVVPPGKKPRGEWQDIPSNGWTLREFDWERSRLRGRTAFRSVQVKTKEMLRVFPRPECDPQKCVTSLYPGVMLWEDHVGSESPESRISRSRGKPPKAGGAIKMVVQNIYMDRHRRGQLAEKTEAIIQEAIDYVELAFNEKISRTTAQSYLSPILEQRRKASQDPPIILPDNVSSNG